MNILKRSDISVVYTHKNIINKKEAEYHEQFEKSMERINDVAALSVKASENENLASTDLNMTIIITMRKM